MATATEIRNSKLLTAFQEDLVRFRKASGRSTNEVLAGAALNFSIKYSALLRKVAPTPDEITRQAEVRGYNVRVRKKILQAIGARGRSGFRSTGGRSDFRGGFRGRRRRGERGLNKRAIAVRRELAMRRSSVKWLAKSVPKWKAALNKDLPEGNVTLGKAFTRGKTKQVGSAKGAFTEAQDKVIVRGEAFALEGVDASKGELHKKVLVGIANDRIGRNIAKEIKKDFRQNVKKLYS